MKNSKFLYAAFFMLLGIFTLLFSCKKDEEEIVNIDKDTSLALDNNIAEKNFDDVSTIGDQGYAKATGNFKSTEGEGDILGDCATITLDTLSEPHSLTIDFGQENCLCGDGRYRRGKVNISFTGPYREPGTVLTHTFENYFVNDNQVLGTKTVTNMGVNTNDNLYFQIVVDGQIIKANNGGTVTWTSNRVREWIEGEETPARIDDVYLITGSSGGTNASGKSFTMEITNPLRKEIGCRWFVSGTYILKPEGKYDRTVDFGDGECDNEATVTINGVSYVIILP